MGSSQSWRGLCGVPPSVFGSSAALSRCLAGWRQPRLGSWPFRHEHMMLVGGQFCRPRPMAVRPRSLNEVADKPGIILSFVAIQAARPAELCGNENANAGCRVLWRSFDLPGGMMPYKNGRIVCGECGSNDDISVLSSSPSSYGLTNYDYRCESCGYSGQTSDCDHKGTPRTLYEDIKLCARCHQRA